MGLVAGAASPETGRAQLRRAAFSRKLWAARPYARVFFQIRSWGGANTEGRLRPAARAQVNRPAGRGYGAKKARNACHRSSQQREGRIGNGRGKICPQSLSRMPVIVRPGRGRPPAQPGLRVRQLCPMPARRPVAALSTPPAKPPGPTRPAPWCPAPLRPAPRVSDAAQKQILAGGLFRAKRPVAAAATGLVEGLGLPLASVAYEPSGAKPRAPQPLRPRPGLPPQPLRAGPRARLRALPAARAGTSSRAGRSDSLCPRLRGPGTAGPAGFFDFVATRAWA